MRPKKHLSVLNQTSINSKNNAYLFFEMSLFVQYDEKYLKNIEYLIMKQKNGIQIVRWDFVMSQILKLKALKIADLRKMLKCFDWWVIVSHQFPLAGYGTVALANNAAHRIYRSPQSPTTASRRHDEDGYRFRAVVQQKSATTPESIGEPLGLIRPDDACSSAYLIKNNFLFHILKCK